MTEMNGAVRVRPLLAGAEAHDDEATVLLVSLAGGPNDEAWHPGLQGPELNRRVTGYWAHISVDRAAQVQIIAGVTQGLVREVFRVMKRGPHDEFPEEDETFIRAGERTPNGNHTYGLETEGDTFNRYRCPTKSGLGLKGIYKVRFFAKKDADLTRRWANHEVRAVDEDSPVNIGQHGNKMVAVRCSSVALRNK
jgi:hypothetical protein